MLQALVAIGMLFGHWAAYVWRTVHVYLYYRFEADSKVKQKHP